MIDSVEKQLVKLLNTKLCEFRLLEATGVATALETTSAPQEGKTWKQLADIYLRYHGALLDVRSLSTDCETISSMRVIALERRNGQKGAMGKLLERIYEVAYIVDRCVERKDRVLVEYLRAYYALVNQDGIRVCLWLARLIEMSGLRDDLPKEIGELAVDLRTMALTALNAPGYERQWLNVESKMQSVYAAFQIVSDYLGSLLGESPMIGMKKYALSVDDQSL